MANEEMIPAHDFCKMNGVEISFLNALSESGLLQFNLIGQVDHISSEQLPGLEKCVRLHYEMGINVEGIEAVQHLLEQIRTMQEEMNLLRSRLAVYEHIDL
jgi:hypothetical protein